MRDTDPRLQRVLDKVKRNGRRREADIAPGSRGGSEVTLEVLDDTTDRDQQHRLEIIGELREVLVDGRTVWRASRR